MKETFLILLMSLTAELAYIDRNHYRDSIPRFRTTYIPRHEVYLGDETRMNCQAVSKTPSIVEWYRNDQVISEDNVDFTRVHQENNRMVLHIKRIDVSDQGLWSCRVHNSYGQIARNFTVEVIDFCDYFLIPDISRHRIPMECVCLWHYTREAKRTDVDYSTATHKNCMKYASRMISRARKPFSNIPCFDDNCANVSDTFSFFAESLKKKEKTRNPPDSHVTRVTLKSDDSPLPLHANLVEPDKHPIKLFDWLTSHRIQDITHLLPKLLPPEEMKRVRIQLKGWDKMSNSQKIARARHILSMRAINHALETEYINAEEDEDEEDIPIQKYVSPDAELKELNVTADEAPYFKGNDPSIIINETHALPAGRTLKLSCKASGYPEPKIIWFKDGIRLEKGSSRSSGYEYKFKRWSLELEDAVVADSGNFYCEAWNIIGKAVKHFNVLIVNRMRRPPIIVPNILTNQSVNVNDTARFHCKVVSDLLPHIMWVRINKVNGSYHYYNQSAKEYMFNYTEMDTMENAHVHHYGDESSLTLYNVSLDDQGIYACLSGNSLGMTMANATLIVNDFVSIHLLTGDEPKPDQLDTATILFLVLLFLLFLLFTLISAYLILYRAKLKKKSAMLDDTVGLVAKRKRIVVNKKSTSDNKDGSSDMPSPYQIQIIEEPITAKEAGKRQRKRVNSENTILSEYEVETDPHWEIDRSQLQLEHMLGEGAFGEVWKAMLSESNSSGEQNGVAVAVKKLKLSAHQKELIDLVSEMETFKVIGEHDNVLRLIGCCTGAGPLYVIVELCRHGNLRDFLRAHRPKEEKVNKKNSQDLTDYLEPRKLSDKDEIDIIPHLTQRHLVDFAFQVAKGMDFMASKKIIHRDLAARNVLVADNHILKISDFGLSRDVHCNDYYRKRGNGRLPIKWMALEALDSHVYTIESDIWSFGILLWEIMTLGGTPYPTIAMPELYATLKEGYRMEAPHNCPEEVYNIMVACWQEKRENRPSFSTIVSYLEWMLVQSVDNMNETNEIADRFYSEQSTNSGPVSPINVLNRRRKNRPLSAPVSLLSQQQHSICDDAFQDGENQEYHFYCNDRVVKKIKSKENISNLHLDQNHPKQTEGYVRPESIVRVMSTADQSLDSAIGSPAWNSYDRASNNNINSTTNASCLGNSHQYYNFNTDRQFEYLHFNFDTNLISEMNRSRDSAIFEESFYSRYPYHPLYSNVFIRKKNMTTRKSLPTTTETKETIV